MKGGKPAGSKSEDNKKLFAEPKFMIPPDALKLP